MYFDIGLGFLAFLSFAVLGAGLRGLLRRFGALLVLFLLSLARHLRSFPLRPVRPRSG
jgi:hypothetical protein